VLLCAGVAPAQQRDSIARADSARRDSVARAAVARRASTRRLATVVVRAGAAPVVVGGASAVVAQPDSLRLLPPSPRLDQVLRKLPFVLVRQNSRGEAEISVRGSDSRQAAVLLDGVPLTLGWDHRSDPSLVPLTGAQSVVLVRGLSSLLYGPNTLGGVVEVGLARSALPADPAQRVRFGTAVDQLGSVVVSLSGGAPLMQSGGLTVRGGGSYRDQPGFARSQGVADPGPNSDLRTNSDLRLADAFAVLRYQNDRGRYLGATASGYQGERGVPPELHLREPRLWRYPTVSRFLGIVAGGTGPVTTPLGSADIEASVGWNEGNVEIESFESRAYDRAVGRERGDERTLTARLEGDHTLGTRGQLSAASTVAEVTYDERLDDAAALRYRQRLWSIGSEAEWQLPRLTRVSGGLVLDGATTPESGDKPSLGRLSSWGGRLGFTTLAWPAVRLHGALSRRARFPALRELYSGALGRFEPNPDLAPERLFGVEGGFTTMRGGAELQGVLFHHRLSDAIVRVPAGDRRLRRENRDQIRSTGLELLGEWRRGELLLQGTATLQRIRLLDPTAAGTTRRPEHNPEVRGSADVTLPLSYGIRGLAGVQLTGRQYCVNPELEQTVALAPQARGDVGLDHSWTLRGGGLLQTLRTTLALDNVADAAVYDQCGMPQPGRTVRLSLELR